MHVNSEGFTLEAFTGVLFAIHLAELLVGIQFMTRIKSLRCSARLFNRFIRKRRDDDYDDEEEPPNEEIDLDSSKKSYRIFKALFFAFRAIIAYIGMAILLKDGNMTHSCEPFYVFGVLQDIFVSLFSFVYTSWLSEASDRNDTLFG